MFNSFVSYLAERVEAVIIENNILAKPGAYTLCYRRNVKKINCVQEGLSHELRRGDQQGTNFDKFGFRNDHLEEELRENKSDLYLR